MAEEIEAKVRVADPDAFRRCMVERGGEPQWSEAEFNRLFDDAAGTLRRSGSAVRLRAVEAGLRCGGAVAQTFLTYKGPRRPGPLKQREEVETEVESAEAMRGILGHLGLHETFCYEKRRTVWHVGPCEVALDELPHLGWFVEVEGPTAEAIRACLEDVGLAGEPLVAEDYIHLLTEELRRLGRDPARAAFEA